MARLRVHAFTLTLDGFGTGTNQRADAPFGDGVEGLHEWMFASFRGEGTGVDHAEFLAGNENVGATIMGRNMFGPVRGAWPDESSARLVGRDAALRPRRVRPDPSPAALAADGRRHDLPLRGGESGRGPGAGHRAAGGADVRLGGGVATLRAFLAEGLVDEMHLVIAPILAGAGERLFDGLDALPAAGYRVDALVPGESGNVHARVLRR